MAFLRSKKIKGNTYYYIVEGRTDKNGKVKQNIILYLGNVQKILSVFSFYKKQKKH